MTLLEIKVTLFFRVDSFMWKFYFHFMVSEPVSNTNKKY